MAVLPFTNSNSANDKSDRVDFAHPDYMLHFNQIETVKNIFNGIDSCNKYIYKTERETYESLDIRRKNATLKNFVKRSIDAYVGMIFRKQIETVGLDPTIEKIFDKIDLKTSFNQFAKQISTLLIRDGKVYVAADTSKDGSGSPYAVIFERNSVINWNRNEDGTFKQIVVKEVVEQRYGMFGVEYVDTYRVYRDDGTVSVYVQDGTEYALIEVIETEYSSIPIVEISIDEVPPMYDVAKMTVKHLNRTSLKDKYLNMCSIPIPVIWGVDTSMNNGSPTKPVLVIGADEAFLFSGTKQEADFEWRELTGTSIEQLQKDLLVIENDITTGIIRASTSTNQVIKSATQAFYEASESSNRVGIIATALETGLNELIKFMYDLANIEFDNTAKVVVNKDFNAIAQNSDGMRLLWEVYLGGGVSTETFIDSLAKYELIEIASVEEEMNRITNDKFSLVSRQMPDSTKKNMDNNTIKALDNTNA